MRVSSKLTFFIRLAILATILLSSSPLLAQDNSTVVRVVMFWMDGCPHCHQVIDTVLAPLQQQYGEQLDIQLIEIETTQDIEHLYAIAEQLGLSKEETVVPLLLIGEYFLIGSTQIPAELPGLIEEYLNRGGIALPSVAVMAELNALKTDCLPGSMCPDVSQPSLLAPATGETDPAIVEPTDPAFTAPSEVPDATTKTLPEGAGFAILIMAGMILAIVYGGLMLAWRDYQPGHNWNWALPLLTLVGIGVSAYLAFVETRAVAAVCGPVGDCNAVQTSEYAYLFGIPIGLLGVAGYLAILGVWAWGQWGRGRYVDYASTILYLLTLAGVLFSLYLTFLEPFVIQAVCAWCLTSAVIMTLLMLVALNLQRAGSLRGARV